MVLLLTHFVETATENLIEAYSQASEAKMQLSNYQSNVLNFKNFIRATI
jgi:hypothetical protein